MMQSDRAIELAKSIELFFEVVQSILRTLPVFIIRSYVVRSTILYYSTLYCGTVRCTVVLKYEVLLRGTVVLQYKSSSE
jgi:hypothetical protein